MPKALKQFKLNYQYSTVFQNPSGTKCLQLFMEFCSHCRLATYFIEFQDPFFTCLDTIFCICLGKLKTAGGI